MSTLHGSQAWRKLSKAVREQAKMSPTPPLCSLCGKQINMLLPSRSKWGCVVDHVIPVASNPGGLLDPTNLQLAHQACNASKCARGDNWTGNVTGPRAVKQPIPQQEPVVSSRVW